MLWRCEACYREFDWHENPGAHPDGFGERCSGAWVNCPEWPDSSVDRPNPAVTHSLDENQAQATSQAGIPVQER